jgi:LmbE family N-acetylglucosaminyl deacetylase
MPRNRTLACVVAHPDDDAYGVAGSVALHAHEADFRFVLIHATAGEGGDIRPGFPATRETLGAVRRAEDEAAWRAVGREPDRHEWLGLPDGRVADVPFDDLVDAVATVLDEEQPAVVATFGPDGIFGHPDHVAVGAATDAAFARLAPGRAGRAAFRRLVHCAISAAAFERWNRRRAEIGRPTFDPARMYHMRPVPDATIGVTVDCGSVAARIVAGLQRHESQLHVMSDHPMDPKVWERVVTREWYVVAAPPRPLGAPMLADLFEGLD